MSSLSYLGYRSGVIKWPVSNQLCSRIRMVGPRLKHRVRDMMDSRSSDHMVTMSRRPVLMLVQDH